MQYNCLIRSSWSLIYFVLKVNAAKQTSFISEGLGNAYGVDDVELAYIGGIITQTPDTVSTTDVRYLSRLNFDLAHERLVWLHVSNGPVARDTEESPRRNRPCRRQEKVPCLRRFCKLAVCHCCGERNVQVRVDFQSNLFAIANNLYLLQMETCRATISSSRVYSGAFDS
jgi:hypothetical protein